MAMGDSSQQPSLVEQAVRGDVAALERLLMRGHARLSGDLLSRLPNAVRTFVSIDDVLQDAYVTVFREITTFRPRGEHAFHRWVTRIAENRLFDIIKAERTLKRGGGRLRVEAATDPQTGSVIGWLETLAVHQHTPSQSAAGREAISLVEQALGKIKQDYRQALKLRYVDGLSVAQTADRMRRTEGAVCLLCHRGLREMGRLLGSATRFFSTHA